MSSLVVVQTHRCSRGSGAKGELLKKFPEFPAAIVAYLMILGVSI